VSIEVYSDAKTTVSEMLKNARWMNTWIPNAHIKLPTTHAGLEAASILVAEGIRVNMTLCFSQLQAAAVYSATQGATRGQVFVSPFIGRLDDIGENGIDLIANCMSMFKDGDHHVEVLSASVRTHEHFMACLALESDIITAPISVYEDWAAKGFPLPGADFQYKTSLKHIPYLELNLNDDWKNGELSHILTDQGIIRFSDDWNNMIGGEHN
jgi:transaldolase